MKWSGPNWLVTVKDDGVVSASYQGRESEGRGSFEAAMSEAHCESWRILNEERMSEPGNRLSASKEDSGG